MCLGVVITMEHIYVRRWNLWIYSIILKNVVYTKKIGGIIMNADVKVKGIAAVITGVGMN